MAEKSKGEIVFPATFICRYDQAEKVQEVGLKLMSVGNFKRLYYPLECSGFHLINSYLHNSQRSRE